MKTGMERELEHTREIEGIIRVVQRGSSISKKLK